MTNIVGGRKLGGESGWLKLIIADLTTNDTGL